MPRIMSSRVTGIGPLWLERRQMGFKNPLGTNDYIHEQIYSNILPSGCWDHSLSSTNTSIHGGVFSLEFSPEGSLLVAACEKRSVLVFDPLTHKRIHTIENAHADCVNCVKFLDSRSFATCSDDFTVALWDARNLSQKVRSLRGHTNWVKNIEYSPQDGLLVTSGFDGSILTWEMNKYREEGTVFNKVFATNGLMRTRLTPDASKMIICTTGGYLIVIHSLDLNTLSQDLDGFKPNMYRLMQLSQTILPVAADFTHLFRGRGKRNRVEFITDFPDGDDAEVVSSLQIHPDGHSAISRNVSNGEQSEWSCIHNIEERINSDESDCNEEDEEDDVGSDDCKTVPWPGSSTSISTTPSYIIQHTVVQNDNNNRSGATRSEAGTSTDQRDLSVSPSDVWEALVAIQDARIRRERDRATPEIVVRNMFRRQASDAGIQVRPLISGPDNRIYVTRIVPNSNTPTETRETNRNGVASSSSTTRRNVSVYTIETAPNNGESPPSSSSAGANIQNPPKRTQRKKIPPLQRFYSLYRRSLVGQYDRTSILRKPMYNPRPKLKRLHRNIKLHVVGEPSVAQDLQNEQNGESVSISENRVEEREQPSGSGIRMQEGQRSILRRRINAALQRRISRIGKSGSNATQHNRTTSSPINTALNSLRHDINSIESNLNSFRQSCNNLEGTINSALQVLRRSGNILQSINNLGGTESNNVNNNRFVNNAGNNQVAENAQGESEADNEESAIEGPSRQEPTALPSIRTIRTPPPPPPPPPRPSTPPTSSDANSNERTILMGVFRAGNEDGVRGTSMRRHNVAAITVSSSNQRITDTLIGGLNLIRNRSTAGNNSSLSRQYGVQVNKKIHQNINRLTHFVEEPNLGRGFIKELCVSSDGRVICSPFGNGIRLLSFSPSVQDLSHCYPHNPPIPLHELSLNMAHSDIVVSTKFSPFHNLLVSGCLSGKIVYYQPSL